VGQAILSISENGSASAEKPAEKPAAAPASKTQAPVQAAPVPSQGPVQPGAYQYVSSSGFAPPAAPSIRKMASELGIDLGRVRGSERGGRIILQDVANYIRYLQSVVFSGGAAPAGAAQAPKPVAESIDFSKWGPVTKKPLTSLRKKIAEKMQESWTTIPHVTQNDEADVTAVMALVKKYAPDYEKKGVKLTLTAVILKACTVALKKFPGFNASLDEAAGELVLKNYYHVGVAVDTEQGLIVPVLRDVDKKDLLRISKELGELAEKTRQRKVGMDDLKGGTFTVSNLGGIGGQHFTPIINKPEVAILGVSRGMAKAVVIDKKIEQRVLMPLSLSYDHRVVDGADGARFIRELVQAIEKFPEDELRLGKTSLAEPASAKKDSKSAPAPVKKGKK
jgi:pyruvate dehydrogenase E2 component (dihydrolipoamide acetyltransferase)